MSRNSIIAGFAVATVLAVGLGYLTTAALGVWIRPDGEVAAAPSLAASEGGGSASAPRSAAPPRLKTADEYLDVVMGKNIFDEGARQYWASRKPGAAGASAGDSAEAPSDLKVTLLGTVVATPREYSSALILEDGKDNARGYGIGDKLYDRKVVEIEAKRVTLERPNGEREVLAMEEEQRPTRSSSSASKSSGDDSGIEKIGENKWVVPRSLLDKYIGDLGAASKLGRALLHRGPDGNYDGYRLSAIRRGSLADQLGIKNGDVIHAVNGQNLDSMQAAMGAYNTMQNDDNFCLDVTRRGEKQTLCYDVQ